MATGIEIRESAEGILVKTVRKGARFSRLIQGSFSGGLAGFIIGYVFYGKWVIPLSAAGTLVGTFSALRDRTIQLRITEIEFVRRGVFPGIILPRRRYSAAGVRWLEFQEEAGGGSDVPYHPAGLYAVLESGSVCLLPYIDEHLTLEVITKIAERFPSMADRWHRQSPFNDHYMSLGL